MVSGVPEQSGPPSERVKADNEAVAKMLDTIGVKVTPVSIYRLGPYNAQATRSRLIKIVMATSSQQRVSLQQSKNLKGNNSYKGIFIRPSLTRDQREHESKLWNELKKKRADEPSMFHKLVGRPGDPSRKIVSIAGNR